MVTTVGCILIDDKSATWQIFASQSFFVCMDITRNHNVAYGIWIVKDMHAIVYKYCLKYAHEQQYTVANIVSAWSALVFTDDQEPEELYFLVQTSLWSNNTAVSSQGIKHSREGSIPYQLIGSRAI